MAKVTDMSRPSLPAGGLVVGDGYIEVEGMERREVVIDKSTGRGLGIQVEAYDGDEGGTMIAGIVAGGPAEELGILQINDQIVSVNGTETEGMTHDDILALLTAEGDELIFEVVATEEVEVEVEVPVGDEEAEAFNPVIGALEAAAADNAEEPLPSLSKSRLGSPRRTTTETHRHPPSATSVRCAVLCCQSAPGGRRFHGGPCAAG